MAAQGRDPRDPPPRGGGNLLRTPLGCRVVAMAAIFGGARLVMPRPDPDTRVRDKFVRDKDARQDARGARILRPPQWVLGWSYDDSAPDHRTEGGARAKPYARCLFYVRGGEGGARVDDNGPDGEGQRKIWRSANRRYNGDTRYGATSAGELGKYAILPIGGRYRFELTRPLTGKDFRGGTAGMKFIARLSDEAWGSLKDLVVPKFGPGGVRLGQVVGAAEPPWMKLPQALTRSTPYALRRIVVYAAYDIRSMIHIKNRAPRATL